MFITVSLSVGLHTVIQLDDYFLSWFVGFHEIMIKNIIILILLALGGVFYHLNSVNQRALECVAYVHEGVDLTGRGKNNCTNPELIP